MGKENLYDKIQDLLGNLQAKFNVLEEQIDIDVQMEYFEYSKDVKKKIDSDEALDRKEQLFSDRFSIDDKKSILVKLASVDKVEAFRALERYYQEPDPELKDWAALALHESRMMLESGLLGESQVFISTGLGGKGQKLRYFIVFLAQEEIVLNKLHKKIVKSEVEYVFKEYDSEIEEISFFDNFSTIRAIIPITVQLHEMFEKTIENCNQLGDFLQMNFIVTNVKELSFDEIMNVSQTSKFTEGDEENER